MSKRIEQCFANARLSDRKVLIPFVTAGDPQPDLSVSLMHALVESGADMIELGVPFSDPMADGPVIQLASERAIARGVNLEQVLEWVREFRTRDENTPVVLMGYMNPFERFGYHALIDQCGEAGVDGILMVDCPPEELAEFSSGLADKDIDAIRLIAPTTNEDRARVICSTAGGFIYYVSFKGTTGAGHLDADALAAPIDVLRSMTDLPVAVGFGIKDGETAVAVSAHSDGVVIGSALVELLAAQDGNDEVLAAARHFITQIRQALDDASRTAAS